MLLIRSHEGGARPDKPQMRPLLEQADVFVANHAGRPPAAVAVPQERAGSRMMKRADHRRQIAQRQALDATVPQGAFGLPFKVDDDEIFAGKEQLTQAEISMAANSLARQSPAHQ